MSRVLALAARWFDRLEGVWEGARLHRLAGNAIAGSFLLGLVAIELSRQGWLPAPLGDWIPTNHFHAVELAFGLVLLTEIVGLVFSLGRSVANSLGKQFEVFSLILLRQSFKELTGFEEPVRWQQVRESIGPMAADAAGALLIFVGLSIYYRLQRHQPITPDAAEQASFAAAKKLIGLLLLASFAVLGADVALRAWAGDARFPFFDCFYTVLIFSDILIALISLRTATRFEIVFRNSGFAATTVFMRLSLTAPPYVNAAIGVLAVAFACGVTLAYNRFLTARPAET